MTVDNILSWKFKGLDDNRNELLEYYELERFLRRTKKTVTPKKCGKTMLQFCDKNSDSILAKDEWFYCFGLEGECSEDPRDWGRGNWSINYSRGVPLSFKIFGQSTGWNGAPTVYQRPKM